MPDDTDFPAADLHRWQRRGHRLLDRLLDDSVRHGLPPLIWTLATSGALTGEASTLSYPPAERRAALERWADHLGAEVETHRTGDGREELYAGWQVAVAGETGPVSGCFRATLFAHDHDKEDQDR